MISIWRWLCLRSALVACMILRDTTLGNVHTSKTSGLSSVLVLDIDGTVYDDDCLIESQIRDNCHIFSRSFGYNAVEAEEMHNKFGSTMRGICEYGQPRSIFMDYYNDVYPHMDMSLLRKYSIPTAKGNTGYNVEMGGALNSLHQLDCPIVIASNSPIFHVNRVLTRLGLSKLKVAAFITPDRRGGLTKNEPSFWDPLFELYPKEQYLCTLIDDNGLNIEVIRKLGMRGLRITPRLLLPEALVHFMNLLPAHPSESSDFILSSISSSEIKALGDSETVHDISDASEPIFEFDEILYLKAKNEIDINSYSTSVRHNLIQQLKNRIETRLDSKSRHVKIEKSVPKKQGLKNEMKSEEEKEIKSSVVTVVDLGAGLLNMLSYTQKVFFEAVDTILAPLELQYLAFESNKNLEIHTVNMLTNGMGFTEIASNVPLLSTTAVTLRSSVRSFRGIILNEPSTSSSQKSVVVTVHLISEDFMSELAIKILKDLTSSHKCIDDDTSAVSTGIDVDDRGYCSQRSPVDLFIGCCVADLISPKALTVQVVEMAGDEGGLLYLPITFCGTTKIIRGEKKERIGDSNDKKDDDARTPTEVLTSSLEGEGVLPLPSDKEVFNCYLNYLIDRGHFIGSDRLRDTLEAYGCIVLSDKTKSINVDINTYDECLSCSSNWKISKKANLYMWNCMMRFIALGTASECLGKYDLKSWFDGVKKDSIDSGDNMMIEASNIDILAILPEIIQTIKAPNHIIDGDSSLCTEFGMPSYDALRTIPSISRLLSHEKTSLLSTSFSPSPFAIPLLRRAVEFISPRNVHIVEEPVPTIGPKQLLVRASCSLVSTGTELKVFKGDLDPDQPADLTINDMDGKMAYPLRYGYSLVGTVIKVGEDLDENDWLGKLVFSFSPHASAVVIDSSSAIIVPKGIPPEDAVFLPSVETAVSFVQAAKINLGEKVLVVGQGLIGMLTGAVISKIMNADVTIADISQKRLQAASLFIENAKKWNPLTPLPLGCDFDLSVEVSGHPSGLQTAIDSTGTNGRIIIGSWYGEGSAQLKLGLKFHRSGLQLITSQVSTIPPELLGRWDKSRRFNVAWDVIKRIKPSSLISSIVPLASADVLAAYNRLERGEEVTILFKDIIGSDL